MLRALDEKGNLVSLLEGIPVKQSFTCPACAGQVLLKNGKIKCPHFAHRQLKKSCYFSENESYEHLSLKAKLYQSLIKEGTVELEKFDAQLNQVADLCINQKLILEVQCSSLSLEKLCSRSQAYYANGFHVLWLLGKKLWLKNRLTALQKQFLYFTKDFGFHLWELDLEKNLVRLKYLIHEDIFGKVVFLTRSTAINSDLLSFFRLPYRKIKSKEFEVKMDQNLVFKVQKALFRKEKRWLHYQELAYLKGENILQKSLDAYYPQVKPVRSQIGFCQIQKDLEPYYQAFEKYYRNLSNKYVQTLYPPYFYVKI
ncbi:competence protein CoiA [Streptococcus catagoni]|uniref:competence protein CoiA n=1 Tax=Streptococcus catagoni TaxID=2654874 RepID=UPI00140E2E51|nr:competence protein CoiA family protein [Streptococcus catagoni]